MHTTARFFAAFFWFMIVGQAHALPAQSPRAQFKESIEQLQKNPDDFSLREKIIALARKVKPAPAVPEEGRKHFVQAVALQKDAKSPSDYDEAIAQYNQALLIAPWWGDAYYNLSVADEAAGRLDAAMVALKLFVATKPKEGDARQAQDRLYVLEAKQAKAAKAQAAQQDAARTEEAKFGWILGEWKVAMAGCRGHCRVEGVAEARKSGNLIELKRTQGTTYLGNHPPESWSKDFAAADGFLRGTASPSGEIVWEGFDDAGAGSCATSWLPAQPDISSDHRTIKYSKLTKMYGTCAPSDHDLWVLTRE